LHISYLHDGDPERPQTRTVRHRDGTESEVTEPLGKGVHSAYEDHMVSANREEILKKLAATPKVTEGELVASGFEAAVETVKLMRSTFTHVPPKDIVEFFIDLDGTRSERAAALWQKFGKRTLRCMQDGTHLLAVLWQSAWKAGTGDDKIHSTAALTPA